MELYKEGRDSTEVILPPRVQVQPLPLQGMWPPCCAGMLVYEQASTSSSEARLSFAKHVFPTL